MLLFLEKIGYLFLVGAAVELPHLMIDFCSGDSTTVAPTIKFLVNDKTVAA
jgi:hypothetical protein